MTVKQARKTLGIRSKHLTDKEIEADIEAANLLKDIFFSKLIEKDVAIS
ncbi:MAG: hypothetical protein HN981_05405 [Candidatus Pacebacteria bacterium]|jgi:hypothetical protein|nr:hypothetical protein [Candidatus Paceibacterota bacterium]MBT6756535.1 hypothetical protein [Candidatus Paceibacterota bacterium]MBT6921795.1 hypothetical protein [Candidatus Paceibacterota bacterium]